MPAAPNLCSTTRAFSIGGWVTPPVTLVTSPGMKSSQEKTERAATAAKARAARRDKVWEAMQLGALIFSCRSFNKNQLITEKGKSKRRPLPRSRLRRGRTLGSDHSRAARDRRRARRGRRAGPAGLL